MLLSFAPTVVAAADGSVVPPTVPHGGISTLAPAATVQSAAAGLSWSIVPGEDSSGPPALRATLSAIPTHSYDTQFHAPSIAKVSKGDVLLAILHVRGHGQQTPEAAATLLFETKTGPFVKSVQADFSVGDQWTTFYFPFEASATSEAGDAQLVLRLGFAVQTVDVGDVQVLNYGHTLRVSDLPTTRFTYPGRETDATWRRAANERIDRLRKGDLRVEVVRADGKPVANAAVDVRMTRHAFHFGTAVSAKALLDDHSPAGDRYRSELLTLFNTATPDNNLKWPAVDAGTQRAEAVVDWLDAHHVNVRGHNLIWPSWKPVYVPPRVKDEYFRERDDAAIGPAKAADFLRGEVASHITKTASTFAGKVVEWDVVNEPYHEHDLIDLLGPTAMADWFKLARAADPTARLVLNDYGILSGGGLDTKKQDFIYGTAKELLDAGAPLGGLGFQAHFGWLGTSPERMLSIFDRFGELGLPIEITEFDMAITDEQLQADFTRDLLTVAFSHPSVDGFVMWGFWQNAHWLPAGAMFRGDWTPKPNAKAYEDLVLGKWWTNASGRTDANGAFATRGFCGDYAIDVNVDGKTTRQQVTLGRAGIVARVEVR